MRHVVCTAGFALLTSWTMFAQAEQSNSCTTNVSRIGFTDQIEGGQPFELWKCQDQWHLSNLGNQQIYIDEKGKPCVKNSTTGAVFCCPNVSLDGKTKTEAPQDDSMAGKFQCMTQNPEDNATAKPDEKNYLYIEPAASNGVRSSSVYKVSGGEPTDNGKGKPKTVNMTIEVLNPEKAGPNKDKSGQISITSELGSASSSSGKKGGPKNPCNKAETAEGSFCQLPANILGHSYELSKETKGAVLDHDKDGNDKSVTSDNTGKKATSEGGGGASR